MRRLIVIPLALGAILLLNATAIAGGWASATLDAGTAPPTAGATTTIGFTVLQHGVTPVSWPRLTLVATDQATDQVVTAAATAEGKTGHYVATISLPVAGAWKLTWDSPDLVMTQEATVLTVAAAAAGAAPVEAAPSALAPGVIGAIGVALLFGLIALAAIVLRRRAELPSVPKAG